LYEKGQYLKIESPVRGTDAYEYEMIV